MQQRRDEDSLAGARQAGDAETDGGMKQMFAEFRERASGEPRLFDDV
jgi:hypothetical protein